MNRTIEDRYLVWSMASRVIPALGVMGWNISETVKKGCEPNYQLETVAEWYAAEWRQEGRYILS